MGADKGKKPKLGDADDENNGTEQIDAELVLSIEKLQEFQDELEKVSPISHVDFTHNSPLVNASFMIFCDESVWRE